MDKRVARIFRSDEVKLEGQVRLKMRQPQFSSQPSSPKAAGQQATVEIIESHPEFALIELTCLCGEKILLRCEYAGAEIYPPKADLPVKCG